MTRTPSPLEVLPPALRRRFVVEAPLGAGGMSEVWRAHDRLLGRAVALKVVAPGRATERERLTSEFALLAELDHPGVVHVHEIGQADTGAAWMISELAEGLRLDRWADTAPPLHARVQLTRDLLATLAWLHGHGLVHGDLKPANALVVNLDGAPWPVLIDFGLALDHAAPDARLLGGTTAYLAPELLRRGGRPSPATDLFALGRCLAPLAGDHPPLLALVAALTTPDPAARPADADAALAVLDRATERANGQAAAPDLAADDGHTTRRGIPRPGRASRPSPPPATRHLGARGHAALWPDAALRAVTAAITAAPRGHHRVLLDAPPDAPGFAASLKAALDLAGAPAVALPAGEGAALARLDALLACFGAAPAPADAPRAADDHRALLDARADAAIAALRGAPELPTVVVATSADAEPLDAAARFLLARLVEADALPRVVLVHGRDADAALGRGVDAAFTTHAVPPPTPADLDRFLARHGVTLPLPDRARALLTARLHAGAAPLRALLAVWRRAGALTAQPGGRWAVDGAARPLDADAPDLDALWAELWRQLAPSARAVVGHLHELGGAAPLATLETLAAGAIRDALAELGGPGWLSLEPGPRALLARAVDLRLARGDLPRPVLPSPALRRRYVDLLAAPDGGAPRDDPRAARALARQLEALDRDRDAAAAWRRAAEALADRHAPIDAGRACLAAARAADRAADPAHALADLDDAARWLDAGGALAELAELPPLARALADRLATPAADEAARLIAARAALRAGAAADALAALDGLDPDAASTPARAFDVALARGTALALLDRQDEAAAALADAADRADALGDLHAVGRVANNLGIAAFHRGDFAGAARAWERSARAKAATGDLRGRRIAMSNRGLALRELDRLEDAHGAALEAAALAERIGDRLGVAMGQLALAQLALDLGVPDRADAALDAFDRAPATSALMRGDAGVLRARALACAGDHAAAAARAAATWADAREGGLDTVADEAWLATYAAWARAERAAADLGPAVAAALTDDLERAAALVTEAHGAAPLRLACLAHAEARAGRWAPARRRLAALLDALDERGGGSEPLSPAGGCAEVGAELLQDDWTSSKAERWRDRRARQARTVRFVRRGHPNAPHPAATPAFDLAGRLCRLLGDDAGADRLDAASARLVAARLEAARAVFGDDAPSADALTRRLGLITGRETARIVQALDSRSGASNDPRRGRPDPESTAPDPNPSSRLTATQQLTLATFDALRAGPLGDAAAWADAVARATGASRCEVLGYRDDDVVVVARGGLDAGDATGGGADRFVELARGLRGRAAPFLAARDDDGLEALGLPLVVDAEGDAVGSLFLAFDDAPAAPSVPDALAPAAACAALAVGHGEARRALRAARAEAAALAARLDEQARAHRDEVTSLRDALERSHSELGLRYDYERIVHHSPALRRVLRTLDKVTDNDLPVLVLGESGVGKELLARALHFNGPRRGGPFVVENCGAVPHDLFESVFFGHVRGAFTGAHTARRGLLEQADGGTLFLDELGELPLEHQVKLLRALQERRFRPVGGQRELASDFRLVAATNRDLPELVREGRFREDLYYRVAVVTIDVPPLRDRPEDVLPIALHLLEGIGARTGQTLELTPAAANLLTGHDWPGNVRELDNEIQRAAVLCGGERIRPAHFSPRLLSRSVAVSDDDSDGVRVDERPLADLVADLERQAITLALTRTGGKKAPAARQLGLSRPGLDAKLERHAIDVAVFKAASN